MAKFENPQIELIEAIGNWGFDPDWGGAQEAYPVDNNICILPNSKEACPITATRPLTVVNGNNKDYIVPDGEPKVLGRVDRLTDTQRLVFSKYGVASLISGLEIFPAGYFDDEFKLH